MTWVPDDEYRRIKASWRGKAAFDYGTARQNVDRCHENMRRAAEALGRLRAEDLDLPPGDTARLATDDRPSLRYRIMLAQSEQAHWREYLSHYQRLAEKEPLPRRATDPIPELEPDARLPREPGWDDDMEAA